MKTYMIISIGYYDKAIVEFTGKNVEAFNLLFNPDTMYFEPSWRTLLKTNREGEQIAPPQIRLATEFEVNAMFNKGKQEQEEKEKAESEQQAAE